MWTFPCAFSITVTCAGFPLAPELTLCVTGLVCTCFGSPGLPLCFLVCTCLSSHACTLLRGLCALVSSQPLAFFVMSVMCSFGLPGGLCALPVCIPPVYWCLVPLCAGCVCLLCHTRPPGPALCASGVVRTGWVCRWHHTQLPGPALCAARAVCWLGLYAAPPLVPKLAICLGPQSVSC